MECSNVVSTRVMFLKTMHEIKQTGTAQLYHCNIYFVLKQLF
jgi:hypothetical protein